MTHKPEPGFCDHPGQQYVLIRDLHTFGLIKMQTKDYIINILHVSMCKRRIVRIFK